MDSMETPNLNQLSGQAKKKVLGQNQQFIFKNLVSKLNEFAQTIRPDTMYAAKYLSTKYGKATKSDMKQAVKLVKKIKEIPNNIVIPNLGEPEDWMLAGVVNASHRTSGNVSAVRGHVVM